MDLKSLNVFIQVAELNSFTRAADKLGCSQPTVSFQIKQLEAELGVQLFERIGHTISLTDMGREVMSYAQHICRLTEEMVNGASKRYEPGGIVRIAMADSLCSPMFLGHFAKFRKRYPNISVKVTSAGTDEMFRLLDHNEVDLVCTLDNHIYSANYIISNEEKLGVSFVCSSANSLASEEQVTVERILENPFLLTEKGMSYRRLLDENLAKISLEIKPVLEVGSADLICRMVEENAGVSFLPDYVTDKAVEKGTLKRLEVENFNVELWKQILYHKDKWISAQMKAVIDYLAEVTIG